MIDIKDPKDCCGCTACASVCAHGAITMEPDTLGFLYPKVDLTRCTDCGLCERVCQFNDHYDRSLNLPQPLAFAARHKDMGEVMKSRSGATFVAVSDYVLEQGGVVYGAGYRDHFRVAHKRATTKEERDEMRGSKYVQSDLTGIFRQVKDDLQQGLTVLFSGTPCQTSGLGAYVGQRLRERLVLMDIVCKGVPGPRVWSDYLAWLEKKEGARVSYVNFRDKEEYGWTDHRETFRFEKGDGSQGSKRAYKFRFYQDLFMRQSCSVCPFANLHRPSDITLADYWGWQRTDKAFNADDKGCSLVLCNTEKGVRLFDTVKDRMNTLAAELANVTQNHLTHPSGMAPGRLDFEKCYGKKGFEHSMKAFALMGWRAWTKDFCLRVRRRLHV